VGFGVVVSQVVGFLAVSLRVAVPSAKQIAQSSWLAKRPARESLVVADRIDRLRAVQAVLLGTTAVWGMGVQESIAAAISFVVIVDVKLVDTCG
jgi:hypothetical protein